MNVAILGAGAIACGTAAFLLDAGHAVTMWTRAGERRDALRAGLRADGRITGRFAPAIADTVDAALDAAETIVIALPSNGHRGVIDAIAPRLRAEQSVVISSHASLGGLVLAQRLAARGVTVPIIAWGTTLVTARQPSPDAVAVSNIRTRIDLAALPEAGNESGKSLCETLFGDRFVPRADLLAIALSNLNPQNHLAIALCNFSRIEREEKWVNWSCVTPAMGRLMEALDAERLAIAACFGVEVRTVREHLRFSYGVEGADVGAMAAAIAARETTLGPTGIATRYVTEDVPFGLVATVRLAALAGVAVPLHEAGIRLFSALYGRDFTAENDLLPELPLATLDAASLRRLAREGFSRSRSAGTTGRRDG